MVQKTERRKDAGMKSKLRAAMTRVCLAITGMTITALCGLHLSVPVAYADPDCGRELLHADGAFETGVMWTWHGFHTPDWGAVAECYSGSIDVCGETIYLTGEGFQLGTIADLYVWQDADGAPGSVLSVTHDVRVGTACYWPLVCRFPVTLHSPCRTGDRWWIGFYSTNFADESAFLGVDLDGPAGCPMAHVPEGIGLPSGWQPASVLWGPMQSFGIGALVNDVPPTPVRGSTWGSVKALYRDAAR
jgi:hypothetical protein